MSIAEKLNSILESLCETKPDAQKSQNGNASAGRRLRKSCMEAIHELKALRALVLENQKNKEER